MNPSPEFDEALAEELAAWGVPLDEPEPAPAPPPEPPNELPESDGFSSLLPSRSEEPPSEGYTPRLRRFGED